jgi:RNA polymerase-binding transcription factor DksA
MELENREKRGGARMPKCAYDDCIRRAKHYGLCYAHYFSEWKRKNGKERRKTTAGGHEAKATQELRWARRAYANAASVAARIDWRRRISELEISLAEGSTKPRDGLYGICEMCGADVELHAERGYAIVCSEACLRARLQALSDDRDLGLSEYAEEGY